MKNTMVFESGLEKIARILARQYNIDVIFEGEQACTDGKKIILPSFSELTPELKLDMNGYCDHEVGHCKFTEMGLLKKCMNRFHMDLLNSTEDIRIEREMIKEFPGSSLYLDPLREKLESKLAEKMPTLPWPIQIICKASQDMQNKELFISEEAQEYYDKVKHLIPEFNECESTKEIFKLTEKMTKILKMEKDKKEEKSDKGKDSEKGEGKGKDKGKGEGKGKKGKDKDKKDEKSEAGSGGNADDMFDDPIDAKDSKFDKFDTDVSKMINKSLKEQIKKEGKIKDLPLNSDRSMDYTKHIPLSTRYDSVKNRTGKGNNKEYMRLRSQVQPLIGSIKRQLEQMLKVKENARWKPERERGSINSRDLCKLASNKSYRTVFREFTKVETNNVAVEILIDMSGSMAHRIQLARMTAIAMSEALRDLQIPFEVTGFNSVADSRLGYSHSRDNRYNRWCERLDHHVFKDFDQSNLTGLSEIFAGANNVDGESVRWAAKRLAVRKEKRKILLVFSDGSPAAEGSCGILNADLKIAVEKILKSGIECVGFGINSRAVRQFYPDYIVIDDLKELPSKVMKKLSSLLLKSRRI